MSILRIGSQGTDVFQMQILVKRHFPALRVDGVYGPLTEQAVRSVQRRHGLYPPDGIAGPITMRFLNRRDGVAIASRSTSSRRTDTVSAGSGTGDPGRLAAAVGRARMRARTGPIPNGVAAPVGGMFVSRLGRRFIFNHEAQTGVSHRLHHPSSGSGVTIGPGYDMKDRSAATIERDLVAVRVPADAARAAAQGAGKAGDAAARFTREHCNTLNLTRNQQEDLLLHIVSHYESMVKRAVNVPLHQHEFDAMVSYAYNPGGGWRKTTNLVNAGNPHEAMLEIKRHVRSKGEVIRSLVRRREAEAKMFIYGEYT